MTNFIETQKELAREEMRGMYYDDSDEFPRMLDTLITQVIQNTLEEVGRRAEPDNTVSLIAQAIRERDTYWKERVEKLWGMLDDIDSVPDMLHPNTERGHESTWKMMVAIAEKRHKILKTDGFTLTPITNEDNLK